jgi:hypothetical protein
MIKTLNPTFIFPILPFHKYINGNTANDPLLEEYTYHPIEERVLIKKTYSGGSLKDTTYYISKDFVRVINSSGTFNFTYVYHEGQLVAELQGGSITGTKKYLHPDHLGSTTLVTDSSGNLVENTFYTPYGRVIDGGSAIRYGYEGKEHKTGCTDMPYDNLSSYYPFAGDAKDNRGSYDGFANGSTITSGKIGTGYLFHGNNSHTDYISVNKGVINQTEFTISVWDYVPSDLQSSYGYIFSDSNNTTNLYGT